MFANHVGLTTLLLQRGANPSLSDGYYHWTPLHKACWLGLAEMVQVLVAHGASIRQADQWKYTPLHMAAWSGCMPIVRLLLHHAVPTAARDRCERTALHVAVQVLNSAQLPVWSIGHGSYSCCSTSGTSRGTSADDGRGCNQGGGGTGAHRRAAARW